MTFVRKWGQGLHLTRALFNQGRVWVTASGEVKKIEEMEPTHLLNTLLMIERMRDLPIGNVHDSVLCKAMHARLVWLLPAPEPSYVPPPRDTEPSVRDLLEAAIATSKSVVLVNHSAEYFTVRRMVRPLYIDSGWLTGRRVSGELWSCPLGEIKSVAFV